MRWETGGKRMGRAARPRTWSWSTWKRVQRPVSMGMIAAVLTSTAMVLASSAAVEPLHALVGHTAGVNTAAFSPDGTTLASGALRTKLWDLTAGKGITALTGYDGAVTSVTLGVAVRHVFRRCDQGTLPARRK